jgi:GDPmannose 4,6-dehydratase
MKRVIIVGANGQDGRILYERLCGAGCAVLGIARDSVRSTESHTFGGIGIDNRRQIHALLADWRPAEVYYVAAHHHSSQDDPGSDTVTLFERSHAVHVRGLLHFLEAIRDVSRATRLFYAASSLVFGDAATEMQDERTPMNPCCIYGITKTEGVHCCRFYRETHGVFASAGILYNHESAYRQEKFVSQKIIRAAVRIAAGSGEKLILGDLSAKIDWGYAPDFAEAMVRMLALPEPDDFVVATGETHTVREFAAIAFARLGLDWRAHVEEDASVLPRKRRTLIGNASKLRTATGWQPSVTFAEMVERLATASRSRES